VLIGAFFIDSVVADSVTEIYVCWTVEALIDIRQIRCLWNAPRPNR